MGTRGFVGLVNNGVEKITYNHFDSYPSGVGTDLLAELVPYRDDLTELRELASELTLVSEDTAPTDEERARYAAFADTSVSTGEDWYSLLRENQGSIVKPLKAGVMTDGGWMVTDAPYSEWGYLVDLDTGTFEVYQGHFDGAAAGRWAGQDKALNLVAVFNLHDLPEDTEFLKLCGEGGE